MPGGDRTGPLGMGPMTGRGLGFCAGYASPGYLNPSFGLGRGMGFGRGRGRGRGFWRWGYYGNPYVNQVNYPYPITPYNPYTPQISAQEESKMLKDQIDFLEEQIKSARDRIKELERDQESKSKK
ncbi:MAG: DUF5320 domain-containing protein [Spirochaetes bacterium]|nr:DUF5320 domain-containing protein [Spirochaetota bacterium]